MFGAISGAITGGVNRKYCFVAGTSVLTAFGYVAIENVSAGDKVWAEDPKTGEKAIKEVIQTFVNETDELVHVHVNGEEIIATPEHPFYVPGKGWIGAIDLRAGDLLVLQSGEYVVIEMIQHEILESPITVYNFEVEDFHTYYVGKQAVLVHNKCIVDEDGVKVEVRTSREHGKPHGHVSGKGANTTVGLDGLPMKGHPAYSKKQLRVIKNNWETIKNGIIKYFPKNR